MTKGQWIKYTGSDEQIAEIDKPGTDVLFKLKDGEERLDSKIHYHWSLMIGDITHYLICNPHPLRDMIKRQADTGQPVWVRFGVDYEIPNNEQLFYDAYKKITESSILVVTRYPNWNIPNAEYSFTPFEEN